MAKPHIPEANEQIAEGSEYCSVGTDSFQGRISCG